MLFRRQTSEPTGSIGKNAAADVAQASSPGVLANWYTRIKRRHTFAPRSLLKRTLVHGTPRRPAQLSSDESTASYRCRELVRGRAKRRNERRLSDVHLRPSISDRTSERRTLRSESRDLERLSDRSERAALIPTEGRRLLSGFIDSESEQLRSVSRRSFAPSYR